MQQSLEDLSTHHSSIEYDEAPTINFQTFVEHPHMLEIYYYIFYYHTFSKEGNASSQHIGSGVGQLSSTQLSTTEYWLRAQTSVEHSCILFTQFCK